MSITLTTVTSGYNLSTINANFQALQSYVNSNLLARTGSVAGEAMMERDLDMNGNSILNTLVDTSDPTSLVNVGYVDAADTVLQNNIDSNFARTLRVPSGETVVTLPRVDLRMGRYLAFDAASGQPVMVQMGNDTAATLALNLASSIGTTLIGTPYGGTVKDALRYVSFEMFGATSGTTTDQTSYINACATYAVANNLPIWSTGTYYITGTVNLSGVRASGFTLTGPTTQTTQKVLITTDTTLSWVTFQRVYIEHDSGALRITDFVFKNIRATQAVLSGPLTANGSLEMRRGTMTDCYYGVLRQGGTTGFYNRFNILQGIQFLDMMSDCIEMNLAVNDGYTLVEDIFIDGVVYGGSNANWGLAMGFAGTGNYAMTDDFTNFYKNLTVRNCRVYRARQCLHLEKCANVLVENCEFWSDSSVTTGTGLDASAFVAYGCNNVTLQNITGGILSAGRAVWFTWGVNSGNYNASCRGIKLRNVNMTGSITLEPSANNTYLADVEVENVTCDNFAISGYASTMRVVNVNAPIITLDFAPVTGQGKDLITRAIRKIAMLSHIKSYNPATLEPSSITMQNISVDQLSVEHCNFVLTKSTSAAVYRGNPVTKIDGIFYGTTTGFPLGYQFQRGDRIIDTAGVLYEVTVGGCLLKTSGTTTIAATSVGDTTISGNTSENWITQYYKTAGLKITIPGAGAGGTDLNTTLTRSAFLNAGTYQFVIADPIVTATAAGTAITPTTTVVYTTN